MAEDKIEIVSSVPGRIRLKGEGASGAVLKQLQRARTLSYISRAKYSSLTQSLLLESPQKGLGSVELIRKVMTDLELEDPQLDSLLAQQHNGLSLVPEYVPQQSGLARSIGGRVANGVVVSGGSVLTVMFRVMEGAYNTVVHMLKAFTGSLFSTYTLTWAIIGLTFHYFSNGAHMIVNPAAFSGNLLLWMI